MTGGRQGRVGWGGAAGGRRCCYEVASGLYGVGGAGGPGAGGEAGTARVESSAGGTGGTVQATGHRSGRHTAWSRSAR